MKAKQLVVLAVILVSLLVVTIVMKAVKPKPPREENLVDIIDSLVTPGTITSCRINFQDKEAVLQKEDGVWVVKNQHDALVAMEKFEPLISMLDQMKGELRSAQENLLADYGITDDAGIKVTLRDGEIEVAEVVFGTKKSGFRNFVRKTGSSEVYVIDVRILDAMALFDDVFKDDFHEDFWVDKRIAHFDPYQVKNLFLEKNGEKVLEITTENTDGRKKWNIAEEYPFIVDPTKIQRYVQALSEAAAAEIVSPDESRGFEASLWKIRVDMDDASGFEIILGNEEEGRHYVKTSGKNYHFKTEPDFLRKFDKTDGEFFMNNLFMVNPQTIEELYVRDSQEGRTYHIIKRNVAPAEAGGVYAWESPAGQKLEADEVVDSLLAIKNILLMTRPGPVSLPKDMLTVRISRTDGPRQEYRITRGEDFDGHSRYHYLRVKDDDRGYGIKANQIEALRSALRKVFEKKETKK